MGRSTGRQRNQRDSALGLLKGGGGAERAWADKEGTKRAPAHLEARSPRPPTQIQSAAEAVIGGPAPSPTPHLSSIWERGTVLRRPLSTFLTTML